MLFGLRTFLSVQILVMPPGKIHFGAQHQAPTVLPLLSFISLCSDNFSFLSGWVFALMQRARNLYLPSSGKGKP